MLRICVARLPRETVRVTEVTEMTLRGVVGFFEKTVTRFGSGTKVDCPEQYLERGVYVIV